MTRAFSIVLVAAFLMAATLPCFAQGYVYQTYNGHGQWVQMDPKAEPIHVQAAVADTREVARAAWWRAGWGIGLGIAALFLAAIALIVALRRRGLGQAQAQSQNVFVAGNGGWTGILPVWLGGPRGPQGPSGPVGPAGPVGAGSCQCKPEDADTPPQAECVDHEARRLARQAAEMADHAEDTAIEAGCYALDAHNRLEDVDRKVAVLGDFAVTTCQRPSAAEFYRRRGITQALRQAGFGSG